MTGRGRWQQRVKVTLMGAALLSLGGCGACTKSFNEGFCPSFKDSFLQACTDGCNKNNTAPDCTAMCSEELLKQKMYTNRCSTDDAASAVDESTDEGTEEGEGSAPE